MSERPILMSAPMVRSILAGKKTQTRRIVKGQYSGLPHMVGDDVAFLDKGRRTGPDQRCPYGVPGDRLWVRETHCAFERGHVHYAADFTRDPKGEREHGVRWTPSIHMPRWASRITLEITDVRVERLQEISEADAIAEGTAPYRLPVHPAREALRHVDGYAQLWDSINGAGSWAANPWVWVVSFKPCG